MLLGPNAESQPYSERSGAIRPGLGEVTRSFTGMFMDFDAAEEAYARAEEADESTKSQKPRSEQV